MFYTDFIEGRKIIRSDLLFGVEHFFTTRELCLFSKEADMTDNRRVVEEFLGQKMATNQPVHGINIEKVVSGKFFYADTDGLLLRKGYAAYMNFGDCVPVILYCGDGGIIAHAGWRGTVQKMAQTAVKRMTTEFGVNANEIKAVIGPAICLDCFQVGKDVYDGLYGSVTDHTEGFRERYGEYYAGLKDINKQQLIEAGVEQIDVCPYCTACGEKLFFSYRHENKTGYRHSAVLKL